MYLYMYFFNNHTYRELVEVAIKLLGSELPVGKFDWKKIGAVERKKSSYLFVYFIFM